MKFGVNNIRNYCRWACKELSSPSNPKLSRVLDWISIINCIMQLLSKIEDRLNGDEEEKCLNFTS